MIRKILFPLIIVFLSISNLFAESVSFIDYKRVLNQSVAGAAAQEQLKNMFERENNKFLKIEEKIKNEEKDLISQKKALSTTEYQSKVNNLRNQVSDLQNNKQKSLANIANLRNNAKKELLKKVNPIIKKYMEQNNIRLVLDKESVVLGDASLEITDLIIDLLNKEIKSIKLD